MKNIKDLSVKTKVIAGFGAIMLISAVFAFFVISKISEFGTDLNSLESLQKELSISKDFQINTLNIWQYVTDECLTRENGSLEKANEYLVKAKTDLDKLIAVGKDNSSNTSSLESLNEETDRMFQKGREMLSAYLISPEEGKLKMAEFDESCSKLITHVDSVVKEAETKSIAANVEINGMVSSSINSSILFFVVSFIIAILITFLIVRWFTSVVNKLINASQKFAAGDTNVVVEVYSKDEFGTLAKAFNAMVEKIGIQIQYLDNIPSPIMVVDKEFNIQYMNKFGASLGNKTPEQVINTKCYNHFKTKDCNTEKCATARAMRNNKLEYSETDAKPLNTEIPIAYTGGPIKDKEGKIIGAIEVVTDLTKAKEYENYLDKNVKKLMVEMDKFADGDLTVEIIPEKEDDIIGKLFSQFTLVVKKIKGVINSLTEAVHATASASNQISSSTEELAAGTQEQSAQTGEIASAVNQMTATIVQTTRHAGEAASTAKQAGDNAKKGGEAVEKTIEGINKVAKVVIRAAGVVDELGKSSEQIGEIVQVIDDIADQTNLLALNAAIEAARAGEQGRGFAVVADEVRKLAERTTKATKEIANMIKKIQVDTKEAVTSMNEGTKEVEVGITLAQGAGEALQQIIEAVVKVSDIINQVAAASEEQSSAAEQISKNIESITNVTHETASGTQQIARAAEDLNRLTNNLQDLIQQFKVDNGRDSKYYVRDNGKLLLGNQGA